VGAALKGVNPVDIANNGCRHGARPRSLVCVRSFPKPATALRPVLASHHRTASTNGVGRHELSQP
jgi:hypothetical protein